MNSWYSPVGIIGFVIGVFSVSGLECTGEDGNFVSLLADGRNKA